MADPSWSDLRVPARVLQDRGLLMLLVDLFWFAQLFLDHRPCCGQWKSPKKERIVGDLLFLGLLFCLLAHCRGLLPIVDLRLLPHHPLRRIRKVLKVLKVCERENPKD